jgi:arylsulfatase A-like enzyme
MLCRRLPHFAPAAALLLVTACGGERDAPSSTASPRSDAAASSVSATATSSATAAPSAADAAGSAQPAPAAAPAAAGLPKDLNVLVLSIDSLRADRMAAAGYDREVMPTLNALADESVVYTRFYATSSFTSQTLGGFLAGRYPSELERSGYFFGVYPESELLFPELLQKKGVRTMSAHAHFYFAKEKAGFHQGFDEYELIPGLKKNNTTDENITSPAHTEIILRHLSNEANTKGRFFAWYHLLDPHDQYMGHPEGKSFGKGAAKLYDGELYFVDMHLKKIVDHVRAQPWGKRTMIVVTADHGEAFGEKKMYRHGFELWNVLTHVPLVIHVPGITPRVIDTPRGMLDLTQTILEGFQVPREPNMHGTSLVPELYGATPEPRDVIIELTRTSDNDRRRALVRGDYKIIEFGDGDAFQLYDLKADPQEAKDLARSDKEKLAEMRKALDEAASKIEERCPKMTEKLKGRKKGKPC